MNIHAADNAQNSFEQTSKLSPVTFQAEVIEEAEHNLNAQDKAAIAALPENSALLIVRKGPNFGARFLLDSPETLAGRHPQCGIFLDDVTVSRKHAALVRDDQNCFYLRDLGSLNGSYVNHEIVDLQELQSGDELQIGKYRFTFHRQG